MEWATYYGIEPTACRVRQPRDKGPVESAVNHLYHYVYARIENDTFHELADINSRIWELLDEYCNLPYKGSSRWEIFERYELPNMRPLPQEMYRFRMRKVWKSQESDNLLDTELWDIPHSCGLKAQEKMLEFLDKNLK